MDSFTGKLLVVDDDENNRDMLSRRLQRRGFEVAVAHDGRQAIEIISRQPFDLVLLDVEMPVMNGIDVLRHLRKTYSAMQLPIIIATARTDREDVIEALGLGANDYVTKPIDFAIVLARVNTQLSHKQAVDRIVQLESDVRRQNEELSLANARMKHSLGLAAKIQRSLLPAEPFRIAGLEFSWLYEPCDELGGDILNLFPVGPQHVGLYLLDVSGHGVPAALLSVTLSRMLAPVPGRVSLVQQRGAHGLEPRAPREVAEELNRRFQMYGWNGQYFTLFYGVIDVVRRQLRYVSCGHPPGLIVPATGEPRFLACHNLALGWFPEAEFEEDFVQFDPADRFFLYSDGITETMNDEREQFGRERLSQICCGNRDSLTTQLKCVVDHMNRFRGGGAAADDISALAMEMSADTESV